MRPILKRSANYTDGTRQEVHFDRRDLIATEIQDPSKDTDTAKRARVPTKIAAAFDLVPVSNLGGVGQEKRPDKYKKLNSIMRMLKAKR